jgi:HK97 gp10 family phage protein
MANQLTVKITGIAEVQKMLAEAPKNIVMLGFGRALNAGINVIAAAVAERVPVKEGELAAALVTEVVVDANARGGIASVGFGKMGHRANWVEYGHRMVTHKPGKKQVGDVPAHPFMRPAADASADAAIDAFAETLAATLKQGIL